jgi:transcriptional regulator with XRE-family HTH domain
MVVMTIGHRLATLRRAADISARELDRLAQLGEGHVSMVESGRRPNVESSTAVKLAAVFEASLDWLLTGKGDAPSDRRVRAAVERARAVSASAAEGR